MDFQLLLLRIMACWIWHAKLSITLTHPSLDNALIWAMVALFSLRNSQGIVVIDIVLSIDKNQGRGRVVWSGEWNPFRITPPDERSASAYHNWNLVDKSGRNWHLFVPHVVGLQRGSWIFLQISWRHFFFWRGYPVVKYSTIQNFLNFLNEILQDK